MLIFSEKMRKNQCSHSSVLTFDSQQLEVVKKGCENNDLEIAVFFLGPEDAGFDSVCLPCSIHFPSGAGAVPGGYKLKRSVDFKFRCDLYKSILGGDSAVMLLPINSRSLSIENYLDMK